MTSRRDNKKGEAKRVKTQKILMKNRTKDKNADGIKKKVESMQKRKQKRVNGQTKNERMTKTKQ